MNSIDRPAKNQRSLRGKMVPRSFDPMEDKKRSFDQFWMEICLFLIGRGIF